MTRQYVKPKVFKDSKECTKCNVVKPFKNFHKRAAHHTGYATWCKPCTKSYDDAEHDPKRVFPRKTNEQGQIHCRRCDKYLDEKSFTRYSQSYCKPCSQYMGAFYNLRRLGITPEKYFEMEQEQGHKCKICGGKDNKRLSVDHDHSCCDSFPACGNCVRGLLCSRCNRTLGMIEDNVDLLEKMIEYVSNP